MHVKLPIEYKTVSETETEVGTFDFVMKLYFDEEETVPVWLVDSAMASRLDIAVIPLTTILRPELVSDKREHDDLSDIISNLNGLTEFSTFAGSEKPARLLGHCAPTFLNGLEVTQDVYVVGFPQVIAAGSGTAIWKRGSIASEPSLRLGDRPCFLIDSATRPGLSGAPVIGRFINPSWNNDGRGVLTLTGTRLGFCGLYASRLGKNVEGAQLGIVWHRQAIEDAITGGVTGRSSEDFAGLLEEGATDSIV